MSRAATGTVFESPKGSGRWYAQLTFGIGDRRAVALPTCRDESEAETRKALLAGWLGRLRRAGKGDVAETVINGAAKAAVPELATYAELVARLAGAARVVAAGKTGARHEHGARA